MIKVLVGHRGVGKSSLLIRLQSYFPKDKFLDLDREIESRQNKNISEIFKLQGEAKFRQIELETFIEIEKQNLPKYKSNTHIIAESPCWRRM